ncbi:type II toxin-antitoxin system HicA family toxin [Allofranklinella schreckenbergeri]|uniref:Type II toxin-antitoxin system HicA family toxin n=1 Tax=Allofranklinella schreckenbergeri TaxID=1076744 RepID=A0A3M6Q1N2_9BURK|nr:type II toxin-antitoxin system HicA family toxin [Allofranklinella schreckenbergeri]RMW96846.1 type II toxin-antitoxin system HicA family toxin [Allofranklinella schreckenbergeri]RMX07011.1 type II toxin-antitoxin system HicA family toxin [Allofranklinella schreckenbergeri]
MNRKHRQTLVAIFAKPTRANIAFIDIEALLLALGCELTEGAGSRVRFDKTMVETDASGQIVKTWTLAFLAHRPHPGKEAKRYQVEQARQYLQAIGEAP